ncbi:MAG: glycoside hydrolase, partial [Candidatus Aminicenantes bacterium]|nr:glycoside hydrolase [Candidatus Aminicenantes bacterium]
MKLKVKSGPFWGVLSLLFLAALSFGDVSSDLTPDVYKSLEWRHIGPIGNRVIAVTGVPGNPHVLYCGAASGGVFKTTDGGSHWSPVFDGQSVSSVGSLAVAPSDPNVIWAGTGETFIRSNISLGDGIYRSTDEGRTWTNMGL